MRLFVALNIHNVMENFDNKRVNLTLLLEFTLTIEIVYQTNNYAVHAFLKEGYNVKHFYPEHR